MDGHGNELAPGAQKDWNPYVAGFALGLVLLATYLVMGFGLGSSSGPTRLVYWLSHAVAPTATEANGYMSRYVDGGKVSMSDWMVFQVIGIFLGGLLASWSGRRMAPGYLERGPRMGKFGRIALAIVGGIAMGFAARWARGCTSGQALTGGSVFSVGSWIFMMAVFAGGYITAPFVRRQWR